jgi:hypothetical protein
VIVAAALTGVILFVAAGMIWAARQSLERVHAVMVTEDRPGLATWAVTVLPPDQEEGRPAAPGAGVVPSWRTGGC